MDATRRKGSIRNDPDLQRVAARVGTRLRVARKRAGLTQQQLAGERYTKAYVSALENALVRPSMAALDYLAGRLGTTAAAFMADESLRWSRLEADLLLASGKWQAAGDAYAALLENTTDRAVRAELLLGAAEALARSDHGAEAASRAAEAAETFEALGRAEEAALASYWLSAALYYQDNVAEAKAILQAVLGRVRAGLRVQPDFKLRLLMALSSNEAREGNHRQALSYLEEVRGLADTLDDHRRAVFLFDLAQSYSATGDYEGALRTGIASLALFAAAETPLEMAQLENELALAHLRGGNLGRAVELVTSSRTRLAALEDGRLLAHVIDTQAQIALASGDREGALTLAGEARHWAEDSDNKAALAATLLTLARAHAGLDNQVAAEEMFEQSAKVARGLRRPGLLRQVLGDWADFLASNGKHEQAFKLTREALSATTR